MKIKGTVIMLCIGLICLYMVIPSGDYKPNDVGIVEQDNRNNAFQAMNLNSWAKDASNSANPSIAGVVLPVTGVIRTGEVKQLSASITSGFTYSDGTSHGALDITAGGYASGLCAFGHTDCDDVAMISPFDGIVTDISYIGGNKNADHYSHYYGSDGCHEAHAATWVTIEGTDSWSGFKVSLLHLISVDSSISIGSKIKQGDFVGFMCSQGNSSGTHLHMNFYIGNVRQEKLSFYYDYIHLHSSIDELIVSPSLGIPKASGFTMENIETINRKDKFNSTVNIPEEFLVN